MRKTGLEPARGNPHKNLNLARLPFRHFRSNNSYSTLFEGGCQLEIYNNKKRFRFVVKSTFLNLLPIVQSAGLEPARAQCSLDP